MNRICGYAKVVGIVALAFGAGILLTFFLTPRTLVIIESVTIIGAGVFCLLKK